ncbi:MAG: hypothetical protein HYY02_11395 [Chloroflexi bacterium]|nr:hypothetical protein [Chloroflexota bacterium]
MAQTMWERTSTPVVIQQRRHVLLVSELHYHALRLQEILSDSGGAVTLTPSAEAGLAGVGGLRFDLVIVDGDLGDVVVEALARRLQEAQPRCRLAVMVGWWDERAEDLRAFSDLLVRKPVRAWQVSEVLEQARPRPVGSAASR